MRYLVACLFIWITGFNKPAAKAIRPYYLTGPAQGTTYHITYYASDSLFTRQQADSIFIKLDSSLSGYQPFSLISRFNASRHGITIDQHLQQVVARSLEVYKATGGLSDITVWPLVTAWGFGSRKTTALPDSAAIRGLLPCIGSSQLTLDGYVLKKKQPCVQIDVNGIAQGYSVDVIAGFLERIGVVCYIVEVGGEIRVKGRKPGGDKMKIGIEAPGEDEFDFSLMKQIVYLDCGAITTSGSYRKYYESNGKRITHIINPLTGYSIQNELISVTVYARDGMTADGFDNALMAMGLQKAMQFADNRTDLSAYFIYRKANGAIADTASREFYRLLQP